MTSTLDDVRRLARTAARAADDKKGEATVILDVGRMLAITDLFVVTSAPNPRLVRTIVEEVERRIKEEAGPGPRTTEGLDDARWVLMDYGDFVVHVFLSDARDYYDLERLWGDAPRVEWRDDARPPAVASGE